MTSSLSTTRPKTSRVAVYSAIDSERAYQENLKERDDRPDIVAHMPLSSTLLAMERILHDARKEWYSDAEPYEQTMHLVRKLAGLAVQAGEQHGMPSRTPPPQSRERG